MTDQSNADRVWDIAMKAAVPTVLALGAMLVSHEVRLARVETTNAAAILISIDTRLRAIENAVTRLETIHEGNK